ncbi:hypothetical protein VHEMI06646 [[Torrubiella] hemipterigena]|uniref:Uncharacterized protein n=1 Tax=[Torrubiella] hemipterigena TaxID=1531966 RepID=A0A0A1T7W0_9HYPO|nr:hypothetical protein VHEMI06646 [[Torrubiella] hemipterigena]
MKMSEDSLLDTIHKTLLEGWSSTPIPALSLSAGGLLALADLHTIAQRTVITGGSSWWDALVLAPGLHYQQAADSLDRDAAHGHANNLGLTASIETSDGKELQRHTISNAALASFLKRIWANGPNEGTVTLNVGAAKEGEELYVLARKFAAMMNRQVKRPFPTDQQTQLDWLSHVLYLMSPFLTVSSSTVMALLGDWWGVAFIMALMASRLINIWIIKQRSRPLSIPPKSEPSTSSSDSDEPKAEDNPTEYLVDLGNDRRVILRGLDDDLKAMMTQPFLRNKTSMDGYLEAAAKLIVYLVASCSGNLTQSGAMVLMGLLLASAGLLGLSNAHIRRLQMNGRVALPDAKSQSLLDEESGWRNGFPVESLRARRSRTA